MSNVITADDWGELAAGFETLERTLRDEGGENMLPGVRFINDVLHTTSPDDPDATVALDDVRATYKSLLSGKDLLADFFIWRDDFGERQRVNAPFKDLVARLGRLIAEMTAPGTR